MSKPSIGSQTNPIDHLYVKHLHAEEDSAPVGSLLLFTSNGTIPNGYLECDGSAVSRAIYPDLFAVIGTTYGSGDGSTTFNLPNYSDGKFMEGRGTAGTVKNAGLPNIKGTMTEVNAGDIKSSSSAGGTDVSATGALQVSRTSSINTGSTADYIGRFVLYFDASRSSAIYSDSVDTVQPYSCTVRVLIKAFNGQTTDSALIDITQYANELNKRYSLNDDFTIIYPNGGTKESPANVTTGTTYIEANPFPNYAVTCQVELFYNNEWGVAPFNGYYGGTNYGGGAYAIQHNNDNIVLRTGNYVLLYGGGVMYNLLPNTWLSDIPINAITTLPCRIKVWKIGKIQE